MFKRPQSPHKFREFKGVEILVLINEISYPWVSHSFCFRGEGESKHPVEIVL